MELRLISTTYEGKERITREQTIPFCDDGGREEQLINLYPQVIYQQMDGFGGAITDSAADIYYLMNPEQQKQMLLELLSFVINLLMIILYRAYIMKLL